jgi:hypothetical protein
MIQKNISEPQHNRGNQTAMEMGFELNKNASVKCQPTTTQGFQSKTTKIINSNPSYASRSLSQKSEMDKMDSNK